MSDLISREDALTAVGEAIFDGRSWYDALVYVPSAEHHKLNIAEYIHDFYPDVWRHAEKELQVPSAQPEQRCVNCGRTANNGGWYEDGRTRCPIQEHYALLKDGYCHLYEQI